MQAHLQGQAAAKTIEFRPPSIKVREVLAVAAVAAVVVSAGRERDPPVGGPWAARAAWEGVAWEAAEVRLPRLPM